MADFVSKLIFYLASLCNTLLVNWSLEHINSAEDVGLDLYPTIHV